MDTRDYVAMNDSVKVTDAEDILQNSIELLHARGVGYDNGSERSMGKIVNAFNTITGHALSERDGWLFMQVLKMVRLCTAHGVHLDSYEDNVTYAALMAESVIAK